MGKFTIRLLAAFALMLMPAVALAQLQPGSTGGTIGQTGKSSSGGEESSSQPEAQRRGAKGEGG